jgi:uncharacterized protein YcbX
MSADVRIASLHVYPIKSCAGIAVGTMRFDALGPVDDRRWMIVDEHQQFITQREEPVLARVRPARLDDGLQVLGPDREPLRVAGRGGERVSTFCWDDRCAGFDEGAEAGAWFSDLLRRRVRLLRFDATAPRAASRHWVGADHGRPGALTRFTDGYPLLITSSASLAALNARLGPAGLPEVTMARFRPNVVVDGLDAFGEDRLDTLAPEAPGAAPVLRMVKPCTRCGITEVDARTGRHAPGVLRMLASFRADPALGGAVTFGQNAIVVGGLDGSLTAGAPLRPTYRRH